MYTVLLLILLGLAAILVFPGIKGQKPGKVIGGLILGISTVFFFWFMDFWGQALWFETLGYGNRFWTVIVSNFVLALLGGIFGWLIVYFLTYFIPKNRRFVRITSIIIGTIAGAGWGYANWGIILKFLDRISTSLVDPIFGKNTGFYLFTLPFLDNLYGIIFWLVLIALFATFSAAFLNINPEGLFLKLPLDTDVSTAKTYKGLYINSAVFIFVLAFGKYLARFHIMYSSKGVVNGPGWTDVNVLLPALDIVIVLMIICALILLIPIVRDKYFKILKKIKLPFRNSHIYILSSIAVFILSFWFIGLTVVPWLFESLLVLPNEITFERPYILNNIEFTRHGFGLNKVEEREFPDSGKFTEQTVKSNPMIFSNIRLWDWRALDAVYRQFQEIRLYYQFSGVDVERYTFGGKYRQVMVSGREMNINNLPAQSKTFVNERLQYTHGFGITMSMVNEFTSQGLPHMLIKNIPPVSQFPSLVVKQPQIYYGELTDSYVVVNTKEKEFDYPNGKDNVYTRYSGNGGVRISSFWRKFLYGWQFGGTKFLFSGYPTDSSRIMFHRQILERVEQLAPFLHFDNNPYIVLSHGKLYWIIDAYTTSDYYPYSEPFSSLETIDFNEGNNKRKLVSEVEQSLNGVNYIRNSVKVVVNAFNGKVNFYVFDEHSPIIRVWERIFPKLFKNRSLMPEGLLKHIRYPIDMLLVQGLMYEKYHMTDPTVFYNQEDLWVRATEKYYSHIQPVEPYYIMWQLPGSSKPEYVLILPFTPKNRQVMIGWIAGMSDGKDYGRLLAYQFPKDKMVLGPQQVETKIDQNSYLSGQLTLWDQRGSNVIRGNMLAIPVNKTIFYVEPIYLQAETAAYPELQLIVVMHGNDMSYAKTFDGALAKLFKQNGGSQKFSQTQVAFQKPVSTMANLSVQNQIQAANDAFNNYLKLFGNKHFSEAAKELEKLQKALQLLSNQKQIQK